VGNRRNVITLNGNRYDAVTGELLSSPKPKQPTQKTSSPSSSGTDGFVSRPVQNKTNIKRHSQNISRTTHKSKTLVRRIVNKPQVAKDNKSSEAHPEIKKTMPINQSREQRAKNASKSSLISKFGINNHKTNTKYSPLPLSSPPKENSTKPNLPKDYNSHDSTSLKPRQKTSNVLENAINNSQSHKKTTHKKTPRTHKIAKKLRVKPRFLNITMFVVAGLLLGGYFAYNNVPNLAMQVASTRAGINGTVPAYQAGGFSFNGPIEYQVGQVTIKYKSNSDNRSYVITQKKSEWNSDALLSNHVSTNSRSYQLLQEKGKTIYIYDGDSASWIEDGVWYEIKGQSSLSANQVIKIANSL
jgi:hypothetical protein